MPHSSLIKSYRSLLSHYICTWIDQIYPLSNNNTVCCHHYFHTGIHQIYPSSITTTSLSAVTNTFPKGPTRFIPHPTVLWSALTTLYSDRDPPGLLLIQQYCSLLSPQNSMRNPSDLSFIQQHCCLLLPPFTRISTRFIPHPKILWLAVCTTGFTPHPTTLLSIMSPLHYRENQPDLSF